MKERLVVMNKMNEMGLNEVGISLSALKQCSEGDEVVVLTTTGQVGWFGVDKLVAVRGCKGGTTVTLRDLVSGDTSVHTLRNELPAGVARVRRVSAGVNARTIRKVQAAVPLVREVIHQPEGEFENILDVPDAEDVQESPRSLPEALPAPPMESEEVSVESVQAVVEPAEVASEMTPEPLVAIEVVSESDNSEVTVEQLEAALEALTTVDAEDIPTEETGS